MCGRYFEETPIRGLPYDTAIATFFYRKDMFEKYTAGFEKEYGYPMVYNSPDANYKNILDWTKYIKKAQEETDPYGMGLHMATSPGPPSSTCRELTYSHGQWLEFAGVDDKLGVQEAHRDQLGRRAVDE